MAILWSLISMLGCFNWLDGATGEFYRSQILWLRARNELLKPNGRCCAAIAVRHTRNRPCITSVAMMDSLAQHTRHVTVRPYSTLPICQRELEQAVARSDGT